MRPYLLTLDTQEAPESGMKGGRAVLFAIMPTTKNRTLFATCRHSWTPGTTQSFYSFNEVGDTASSWDPKVLPMQKVDLDLLFIEFNLAVPSERMRVNEWPIQKNSSISHARNIFRRKDFPEGQFFHISNATVQPCSFKSICDENGRFVHLNWENAFEEAKKVGVQTFYSGLEMESWPGVSGSPLWDDFGAIRGMVCGGDSEETRLPDAKPRLVYLPIKTIMKEARETVRCIKSGRIIKVL